MLLTKTEKERLKSYVMNLDGFILENELSQVELEGLKAEIEAVNQALNQCGIEPMFEIVNTEGDVLKRVANILQLEEMTGTSRRDITSRIGTIRGGLRSEKQVWVNRRKKIFFDNNVFSIRNHNTNERVYIRYLKTE